MLACLPGPGDLSLQLLPHTQMNTGPQKWDTTQRMRSAPFPTPAELDAFAKKAAHQPLTIKIFPNSVKVPQRNHVRRTVNGLDTSGQRYSPYPPSQARSGLLAVVRPPAARGPAARGVLKDSDGSRARLHPDAAGPAGPYAGAPSSTLNHHLHQHHPHPHPPQQQQQQHHPHPQQGPPAQAHPQTLEALSQSLGLRHPAPPMAPHHPQGLARPLAEPSGLGPPQGHAAAAAPALMLHPQQQQHLLLQQQALAPGGPPGARKPPEGEAPPNVTVSTSTIPLSMAAGPHHHGPQADLSAIVHQISQFCQARAHGAGATAVCEGQIANPSPISRNLLINACSRVSVHGLHPGYPPPPEQASGPAPHHQHPHHHPHPHHHHHPHHHPPQDVAAMNHLAAAYHHGDMKPHPLQLHMHGQQTHPHGGAQQQQQQQQQLQQQQQQQLKLRAWNQHPLAHMPHMQNVPSHPCSLAGRDPGFPCKGLGYPHPEVCVGQPYSLKPPMERPTPSPPVLHNNNNNNNSNGMACHMTHYGNAHYFQPSMWNSSILPTPNSDSSGSQDMGLPFHSSSSSSSTNNTTTTTTTVLDCGPQGGGHYRLGTGTAPAAQTNLMQTADYLGGDFQTPYLRDHNLGLMGKMHRPPLSRVGPELGDGCSMLLQHPGERVLFIQAF
uniref:Family with sequence similarity 222 member Ba n=1 Tax=Gadus morhua TaxID=8049 RepID=A0A8C5A208_GADMO